MKRVTGLGGVFFTCADPVAQRQWYKEHLGIGSTFEWRHKETPNVVGQTAWSTFPADTKYFQPGIKPYMINYRVENLAELLELLKKEGVQVVGAMEDTEYGKFGWIMDPEGNKIELWEPKDEVSEG